MLFSFFFSFFFHYSLSCIIVSHHCHLCIVFWFVSLLRLALRFFSIVLLPQILHFIYFSSFFSCSGLMLSFDLSDKSLSSLPTFSPIHFFFRFSFFILLVFSLSYCFLFINFPSFLCSSHSPPLLGLSCLPCLFYLS